MKKNKLLLSGLLFLLIIFVTFYSIFSSNSLEEIITNIKLIKYEYSFICLLLIALYFLCQGIYMKYTLKSLNQDITLSKGYFYSVVEFFFSGITPSSTGGQPAQLYYMNKDGIPVEKSLITLILNTIFFKLFLVVFGIIILIFRPEFVFDTSNVMIIFFFLGFVNDIIVITGCLLLMYNQALIKKILSIIYKIVGFFKKEKVTSLNKRVEEKLKTYKTQVEYINTHKKEVFLGLIITFIQRTLMFSISFVIYKSFGFSEYTYFDLLLIFLTAQICIEGLPLPGGTGGSEHFITNLYKTIFGVSLSSASMILTRCFSFYIPLLITMCIIMVVSKKCYSNK